MAGGKRQRCFDKLSMTTGAKENSGVRPLDGRPRLASAATTTAIPRPPCATTAGSDSQGAWAAQKSKNYKTNPILSKPAWKIDENEAKNEPIFEVK
jgi:hypothetical protein